MSPITINLKYGPMVITVEQTAKGWQRISRYSLTKHLRLSHKTLTDMSKPYKTRRGAEAEARHYAEYKQEVINA